MQRPLFRLGHAIAITASLSLTLPSLSFATPSDTPVTPPAGALPSTVKQHALAKGLYQLEYSPHHHRLYAAVAGDRTDPNDHGALLAIDPDTLQITARYPTQARPFGLALDDNAGRLYTSDTLEGSISLFDLNHDGHLIKSVRLAEKAPGEEKYPFRPREIRLDIAHHRLYVSALAEQGRIYVLDSRTLDTVSIFNNVGKKPTGLAIDSKGQRLFLSNGDGEIQILSAQDGQLLGREKVGILPLNLLYDEASQRLYATDYKAHHLTIIDVKDSVRPQVIQQIPTGQGPVSLLALSDHQTLAVTEHDAGSIGIFDLRTGQRQGEIPLGYQPNSLAIVPGHQTLFVSVKQPRNKDLSTEGLDSIARIDLSRGNLSK